MKKKYRILMLVLPAWVALSAITREQADVVVRDYVQSAVTQPCVVYVKGFHPKGIEIITSKGETLKTQYACWVYCLNENEPAQRRYLFVQEESGSLLELIASNDVSELDASWVDIDNPSALRNSEDNNVKQLYPNPVNNLLTLPCNGEDTRVEIYDLKGARLFSELFSGKEDCLLNVSFLNAGIYMLRIDGETYRIIKN